MASCSQPQTHQEPECHPEEKGGPRWALEEKGMEKLQGVIGGSGSDGAEPRRVWDPAPGCPGSPGCGTWVSVGFQVGNVRKELEPPPPAQCRTQHPGVCLPVRTRTSIPTPPTLSPSCDGGEETKKGIYGWPCVHDPAEDYAQPPQPPCPQTAPQPPGCPYSQLCSSLSHLPYPIKPPKNMAWAWHRAHIPWPPTCPNTVLE